MSSTDQTHKEYLTHQDGTVYWPFTAWDAILGIPNDLAHMSDITVAINGLNKFDPNKVFTKDEVNAAIVKAIGGLQDKIYGGDVNAALDTIKELQDAYNGSNSIIQRLLTQVANKANADDVYNKKTSDARYPIIDGNKDIHVHDVQGYDGRWLSGMAAKSDIPDITPLAKQVDLSLVEQYGLPRNYWIIKNQTSGYSMDSAGNPTVANDKAQTSELIKYDSAIQMVFVGWGAKLNDQMTVAYFDKDKKYLSSTIWTITSEGNGDNPRSNIEFYKYAANNAAYIRINCNYGANAKTMIVSSVFENAEWVPALEDLNDGTVDLSNFYQKSEVEEKLSNVAVKHTIEPLQGDYNYQSWDDWRVQNGIFELTQFANGTGVLDLNMIIYRQTIQLNQTSWDDCLLIDFGGTNHEKLISNMEPWREQMGAGGGFAGSTDAGVQFHSYVSSGGVGWFKIGFRPILGDIGANDWRVVNMHIPLRTY